MPPACPGRPRRGRFRSGRSRRQRRGISSAVHGYTMGSAYANFLEDERGSLTVGKAADFVVLSRDIFTVPVESIPGTVAQTVVVAGEVVHRAA
ncbi:amidohydrolase family protein [Streptomyces goshikiensis]|uniref:amidohydrolase family protein n=1 Tax=Streptomyces goshikiensis TaxID=1942 RepID=UPI0036571588